MGAITTPQWLLFVGNTSEQRMLIIFDCDGVLIDSERILNHVFRECILAVGLNLSLEETIQRFKGRSTKDCLSIVENMLGRTIPVKKLNLEYEQRSAKKFREGIRPIPGIATALEKLPYRRCVASSSSYEHIYLGLEKTELISYFPGGIFSASDVKRGKPAPDLFLHAASQLGAVPEECIVIEDSPAGIEAATAAGMTALGFVDLTPEIELQKAGAKTFNSMLELPELIENIRA